MDKKLKERLEQEAILSGKKYASDEVIVGFEEGAKWMYKEMECQSTIDKLTKANEEIEKEREHKGVFAKELTEEIHDHCKTKDKLTLVQDENRRLKEEHLRLKGEISELKALKGKYGGC